MGRVLKPIGHDERLSIVDHLDELRSRLVIVVAALLVAFGLCFWQQHRLLTVLNHALPASALNEKANHLNGLTGDALRESRYLSAAADNLRNLSTSHNLSVQDRAQFGAAAGNLSHAATSLPQSNPQRLPVTIGVGEPFTTTLTVAAYFSLILALPILIYQGYAFVVPALNQRERKVALPVMSLAPLLFVGGVAFCYFVVLGPAVRFLQNYNSQNFDILVGAKQLYTFEILTMLGIGLAFQLPIGLLGLDFAGAINARTLTKHWRYAVVIIAVLAAMLPGADPVTTGLEMLPLLFLYILSIGLLKFADKRRAARAASELGSMDEGLDLTG
jgi:sec-independent protein translocase protein TatC